VKLLRAVFGKYLNLRTEERHTPHSDVSCSIIRSKFQTSFSVTVLDVSTRGMAFAVKNEKFEVGDEIQVHFRNGEGKQFSSGGKILSQHIFYSGESEDLKHAIFRFSVQLDSEIDVTLYTSLRKSLLELAQAS
jgi:hypothetical protein